MKKIVVLFAIICFGKLASAQTDSIPQKADSSSMNTMKDHDSYKDAYITLQGGSVMMVKDNKTTKLEKDKTLKNGTIVMIDGTVKTSDGNTTKLKEGDKIYLDGRLNSGTKDNK